MATGSTAHSLSVVTNSCVKTPKNPRTSHPATLNERSESLRHSWKEAETMRRYAASVAGRSPRSAFHLNSTDMLIESLSNDLGNLSDDEFYSRLTELKNEHQKTLQEAELMYNEKLRNKQQRTSSDVVVDESFAHEFAPMADHHRTRHIDEEVEAIDADLESLRRSYALGTHIRDSVRDMSLSAKPPVPFTKVGASATTKRSPSWKRSSLRRSGSLSSEDWRDITWSKTATAGSSPYDTDSSQSLASESKLRSPRQRPSTAAGIISNMWDNFSVNEYVPRGRSGSLSSSRASSGGGRKKSTAQEWSPKITIPEPFKMTKRESAKVKKKSRSALQMEQEVLEKQKAEEVECQKKFRAAPAPAHTFVPLYQEITERQEEKRRQNRETSKELTKSREKPFKFDKRELEKKKQRRAMSASLPLSTAAKRGGAEFKARPVPRQIFDPSVDERIKEEEEYRRIRVKMRAEELLRQSALPSSMQVNGHRYTDGKARRQLLKDREEQAFVSAEHKFRPKINHDVPDYDQLYRNFQREMSHKKDEKEATTVQPFNLRTSRISSNREKVLRDIESDRKKASLARSGGVATSSGGVTTSSSLRGSIKYTDDTLPSKGTHASQLKQTSTQKSLDQATHREREALEKERRRRLRERKLKRFVAERALSNDNSQSLDLTNKDKIRRFRQSGKARTEEYKRELEEMKSRVKNRPLLFERQSQINAQRQAEKKYAQTLREAGLDENFVIKKSGGKASSSLGASFPYDDDDDLSISENSYSYSDEEAGSNAGGTFVVSEKVAEEDQLSSDGERSDVE